MTHDRARKKAVRRRMAQTGEKYTEARRAAEGALPDPRTGRGHTDPSARREQFRRFTEGARRVVVLAREEARARKHDSVDTEHILLGLLREEEGIAARVLSSLDITIERVHAEVVRGAALGEAVAQQLAFSAGAKSVLELALREALSLGHNYIGTEHILLALARVDEGAAASILLDLGADSQKLRNEVIHVLSGATGSSLGAGAAGGGSTSVFERFTNRARECVDLARGESRELGHDKTGSEHILLGLLGEREGVAGRALEALGVTLERARANVRQRARADKPTIAGRRPFTPRVQRMFELALREALLLGHNYIGTEHLLLGLVRDSESTASAVLLDFGADPSKIRNQVISTMSATSQPQTEEGHGPGPSVLTADMTNAELDSFLRQASGARQLTAQEEVELAKRVERGDADAKQAMVKATLRLVFSIADEYRDQGLTVQELRRAGARGLVRATDTFDYRKGVRFSSRATEWIRQAVRRALKQRSG